MSDEKTPNNVNEELDDNMIILNDEEGKEVRFEFLDLIELDNEQYVVLLPAEDKHGEEPGEVVILQLNKVFEMFKEKFKDEFDFVD